MPKVSIKDDAGHPTGELQEMAAMFPVMRRLGIDIRSLSQTETAIQEPRPSALFISSAAPTVTDLPTLTDSCETNPLLRARRSKHVAM